MFVIRNIIIALSIYACLSTRHKHKHSESKRQALKKYYTRKAVELKAKGSKPSNGVTNLAPTLTNVLKQDNPPAGLDININDYGSDVNIFKNVQETKDEDHSTISATEHDGTTTNIYNTTIAKSLHLDAKVFNTLIID